jgi:hypothetical protein
VRVRPSVRVVIGVLVIVVAIGAPIVWWVTRTEVTCGIVVAVEQTSLTDVTGFTLRTSDGVLSSYAVVAARLAPDSFVPGHLREHRALATPICVSVHPVDSPLVALDLRDAPAP